MYLSTALAAGKSRPLHALRNLTVVWVCNFLGAGACAFFLAYLPELVRPAPQLAFLRSMASKKVDLGWGAMFLRGVGCNWLVCLAFWSNLTAKDGRRPEPQPTAQRHTSLKRRDSSCDQEAQIDDTHASQRRRLMDQH